MPELPEVETVVRGLRPQLLAQCITSCNIYWSRTTDEVSADQLLKRLGGKQIRAVTRRGKYILIEFDSVLMTVHLRMTGRLYVSQKATGNDPWVRVSLGLGEQGFLVFSDARKFGRVGLLEGVESLDAKLGPEPFDIEPAAFFASLKKTSKAIKSYLLDQSRIAGVGNIYADEALWGARLHPQKSANRISRIKAESLLGEIKRVLSEAIRHEGATISWYRKPDGEIGSSQGHFRAYGKTGEPCPRCQTAIRRIVVGQRSTHFCPRCQRPSNNSKKLTSR